MNTGGHDFDTATPVTPLGNSGKGYIAVPWEPLMSGGVGYDSVSHAILPSAAADEFALEERPQGEGQTAQLKIKQVQTLEEVSQLISAQTDLKVGYDVFSATAIGRFLRERRMNKFSLYFLVLSYMERALVRLKGFKLSESARKLASDPAAFRSRYGDYCVEGYIAGGYLIGLAELQVQSEEILKEVQAKVRGKYDRAVTVDAGVESTWRDLAKTAGTDFSLQVIHAGVGEGIRAYAISGQGGSGAVTRSAMPVEGAVMRSAMPSRGAGEGGAGHAAIINPGIANSLLKEWEDGGDDDEEDASGEEPIDSGLPVVTRPTDRKPGNGGHSTEPGNGGSNSGFSPIVNQLKDPPADYLPPLKMNLDGMLKAASALQAQSGKYRVRLLAQLRHYSTFDDGPEIPGREDVFLSDLDKKRKMLSEYYSKASFIHDSVRFALESRTQFSSKESDLLTIKREMENLMDGPDGYTKLWEELKTQPQSVTFARIGNGPDESKIPKWAVKRSLFNPFSEELDPQLFVNMLDEAVDKAVAVTIPERREALKQYLKAVQEHGGINYANAILALDTLSEAFPMLDEKPAKRTREIKSIASMVEKSLQTYTMESKRLHEKFNSLDGKSGLDQKQLTFLGPLNAIVFGGAEDAHFGLRAFWKKLLDELNTLVQKSTGWSDDKKLADLIEYSDDWPGLADAFKTSNQELGVKVRRKLI